MDKNYNLRKQGLFFALGIAAGAVAGWYFNSEKGRELRRRSATRINDLSKKTLDNAHHIVDKSSDYAHNILSTAEGKTHKKEMAEDLVESSN